MMFVFVLLRINLNINDILNIFVNIIEANDNNNNTILYSIPKFSVYRMPMNKDEFVHYLSAHDKRTKMDIVIRFFLRIQRIFRNSSHRKNISRTLFTGWSTRGVARFKNNTKSFFLSHLKNYKKPIRILMG